MTLFFSLLPLYLMGNLHCGSMCGPLVMLLAKHPFRRHYFLGRLLSYSVVGLISSEAGFLFFHFLLKNHLSAFFSLLFGFILCLSGICIFFKAQNPLGKWPKKFMASFAERTFRHVSKNHPLATFFFGFCTVLLPCGQTLVVFSACALEAEPLSGLFNGFFFALLTSPSLVMAMKAFNFFSLSKKNAHLWMSLATFIIGVLAVLRGCADFEWISHLTFQTEKTPFHLVFF